MYIRFYSFWGWKCVRDTTQLLARILRERVCKRRNQTCSLSEAQQAKPFCLTSVYKSIYNIYHSPYVSNIYIYTHISMYVCVCIYIYGPKPWYPRYPKSWLANGCLFPSHPMSVLYTISCYYNYNILLFFLGYNALLNHFAILTYHILRTMLLYYVISLLK